MSSETEKLSERKWFYMKGQRPMGPLTHLEVIKKLQRKEIVQYQFIWAPHFEEWKRACECEEFSKIFTHWVYEQLEESSREDYFVQRTTPRKKVICEVSGHNCQVFFQGITESLSVKGCQVELDYPLLQVNSCITLHFADRSDLALNFNALCEVVQKNYNPRKLHQRMKIKYILKFLQKSEEQKIESILKKVK